MWGPAGDQLIPSLPNESLNSIVIEVLSPEGAVNGSGGVSAPTVGARGVAFIPFSLFAGCTQDQVGLDCVRASALGADEPVCLAPGSVVPPHLAHRTHGDVVLRDPPEAGVSAAAGEEDCGFHQGTSDRPLFVILN